MYEILKSIYLKLYKLLPRFINDLIINYMNNTFLERIRNSTLEYYSQAPLISDEEKTIIAYLEKNKLEYYIPYNWVHSYINRPLDIRHDKKGYFYVEYNGMRLYCYNYRNILFRKNYIKKYFNELSLEMDIRSPHRYVTGENTLIGTLAPDSHKANITNGFCVEPGDIVADIGCAEGNFALSIIDIASHVYLFESDPDWIGDLQRTFHNYRHKVTIINKYVTDCDTDTTVSLDSFFNARDIHFIKADIEGFEFKMLSGAKNLLKQRSDLKLAICTYHNPEDAQVFKDLFEELGYQTTYTKGRMIQAPPDPLRITVIRAQKVSKKNHSDSGESKLGNNEKKVILGDN